jgi:hypothetical protein
LRAPQRFAATTRITSRRRHQQPPRHDLRHRVDIYKRKFFVKFLNNFLAQVTPFFFYSVGGYFVIQGELTLGALVAVLGAYKDILDPWKELLQWYFDERRTCASSTSRSSRSSSRPGLIDGKLLSDPVERYRSSPARSRRARSSTRRTA